MAIAYIRQAKNMSEKKTQIGFRVTDAFRRQIEDECMKRDLSVQAFLTAAVEFYSRTPAKWDYAAINFVKHEGVPEERVKERQAWASLWTRFINTMPRAKILLLAETMKLDLRHYKSSRRKAGSESAPKEES